MLMVGEGDTFERIRHLNVFTSEVLELGCSVGDDVIISPGAIITEQTTSSTHKRPAPDTRGDTAIKTGQFVNPFKKKARVLTNEESELPPKPPSSFRRQRTNKTRVNAKLQVDNYSGEEYDVEPPRLIPLGYWWLGLGIDKIPRVVNGSQTSW